MTAVPAISAPRPIAALIGIHLREAWAEILKSMRLPVFMVPTVAMPAAFYAVFALAMGGGNVETATRTLATFGVFAAMGPALFGFGAGISTERESGQLELKRLSPLPGSALITSKLAAALVFAAIALVLVYGLAIIAGVRLSAAGWASLVGLHLLSVVPCALIGLGIGLRMGSKAAVATANLVFLGLAVLGGLWMPLSVFPDAMRQFAWILPSHHLAEIAIAITQGAGIAAERAAALPLHGAGLALTTMAAAVFAWTGWERTPR